jgi:hypothetical protein
MIHTLQQREHVTLTTDLAAFMGNRYVYHFDTFPVDVVELFFLCPDIILVAQN